MSEPEVVEVIDAGLVPIGYAYVEAEFKKLKDEIERLKMENEEYRFRLDCRFCGTKTICDSCSCRGENKLLCQGCSSPMIEMKSVYRRDLNKTLKLCRRCWEPGWQP